MLHRWRRLRRRHDVADLNITAFMNLMVVLVPFLLITAVFSRMAIHELNLPEGSAAAEERWRLVISLHPDRIDISDSQKASMGSIPRQGETFDLETLGRIIQSIKAQHPDTTEASVLASPDVNYELLVQVMDRVRQQPLPDGTRKPLFPEIAVGDAGLH
jgi:biopolymer transport protein ExbD